MSIKLRLYVNLNEYGNIPPSTECMYQNRCALKRVSDAAKQEDSSIPAQVNACIHMGKKHKVEFSCSIARAFDFVELLKE